MKTTENLHVSSIQPLISPRELKTKLPVTEAANATVLAARTAIRRILEGKDSRLLVITGPCSIHDPAAAIEYANRLRDLDEKLRDHLCLVMRVYFEKPRTTIGWRGLINDPDLDGSGNIPKGLETARKLLITINGMGVPAATEMLDPVIPQYIADLVSWAAIGARTTESQIHREMASGLSMPVGFKNGTDGNLQIAINAMVSARHPHSFLGINQDGLSAVVKTTGNPWSHIVLRGSSAPNEAGDGSNYDAPSIRRTEKALRQAGLPARILVDCSHGNSGKKHQRQEVVLKSVIAQRTAPAHAIIGLMLESNLHAGSQKIPAQSGAAGCSPDHLLAKLASGISVTDQCISWESTERLLQYSHQALRQA